MFGSHVQKNQTSGSYFGAAPQQDAPSFNPFRMSGELDAIDEEAVEFKGFKTTQPADEYLLPVVEESTENRFRRLGILKLAVQPKKKPHEAIENMTSDSDFLDPLKLSSDDSIKPLYTKLAKNGKVLSK